MDTVKSWLDTTFLGESYIQWFLFLLLFTFMWTFVVSLNHVIRQDV